MSTIKASISTNHNLAVYFAGNSEIRNSTVKQDSDLRMSEPQTEYCIKGIYTLNPDA